MNLKCSNGPFNIFAEAEFCVEFFDLDPMCVVWHGNYLNYFEIGRRVLLQRINYSYTDMEESGYAFPVIEISVKYIRSLKFEDQAIVKAILVEYENCLKIRYEIRNAKTGVLTTKGVSTQMAVDVKAGDACFVCPKAFTDKVEALIGGSNT